jgi:benzil reductase ((S)-benzoin forming)
MAERVAVVTGVSKGLGAALGACLIAHGFHVVGVGRSAAPALAGPAFRLVEADFRDSRATRSVSEALFAELAARRPATIAVINNAAAAGPAGTVGALDLAEADESLAVNLHAPIAIADAFVRAFAGVACERRLINVSSGAAAQAIPGIGIYSIGKAGLEMLTRAVATEQAGDGIVAITIRPGVIDTPMQRFARSQSRDRLPSVDMFRGFHESGQLVPPDVTAKAIVERLVLDNVENGRTYNYAEL